MNFKFCYFELPDTRSLNATISTKNIEDDKEDLIASYLVDSGGASLESHIEYLKECLTELENFLKCEANISSNSYGVDICGDKVKICFLYNEDEEVEINRFELKKVMDAWILFLEKEPVEGYEETINI